MTTMASYNELDAILRLDLSPFVRKVFATVSPNDAFKPNWHIDAIAHELTRCHAGVNRRLLITQPSRSPQVDLRLGRIPGLALGHDPTLRIMCVSYSESLASEFTRQFRMITDSECTGGSFPACASRRKPDRGGHDQGRRPGRPVPGRLDHRPRCGLHHHRRPAQGRGERLRNGPRQGHRLVRRNAQHTAQRQGAGGHHPGHAAAAPGGPRRLRDRARRLA